MKFRQRPVVIEAERFDPEPVSGEEMEERRAER